MIESAIRPGALGKRNWLFMGHPEAGERGAVIYTLPGSCWRHGINQFDYLKDLFNLLSAAKITQIKEFTPAAWAKAKRRNKQFGLTGRLPDHGRFQLLHHAGSTPAEAYKCLAFY